MIGNLNHVALVVDDLKAATDTWRDMLGATVSEPQALTEHGVTVVFIDLPNSRIELLEPLGDGSPVSRFLERHRGGGMHHICLEVHDIVKARDELIAKGANILGDGKPKIGAHGNPVIFMHPNNFNGTLIELEEVRVS
jgi:methylmalonyl-CoA/ethylmalonyl-CoA epimerase